MKFISRFLVFWHHRKYLIFYVQLGCIYLNIYFKAFYSFTTNVLKSVKQLILHNECFVTILMCFSNATMNSVTCNKKIIDEGKKLSISIREMWSIFVAYPTLDSLHFVCAYIYLHCIHYKYADMIDSWYYIIPWPCKTTWI